MPNSAQKVRPNNLLQYPPSTRRRETQLRRSENPIRLPPSKHGPHLMPRKRASRHTACLYCQLAEQRGIQLLHVKLYKRRRIPIARQQRSARMSSRISWSGTPVLPVDPRFRSWSSFCSQRSLCARDPSVIGGRTPSFRARCSSRISCSGWGSLYTAASISESVLMRGK
jgi:hypothetical protein